MNDSGTPWAEFVAATQSSSRSEFLKLCPFPAILELPESFQPARRLAYDDELEVRTQEIAARLELWLDEDAPARRIAFLAPPEGKAQATVGRTQGEVQISDPSVSQRHARFYKRQGFWRVLDLESTGGTKVEDRRVPAGIPLPLASGQVLTFGEARHLFLLPADLYGLVQASRRGKGGATARIVLPPEGMLLLDLFSVVKDVEDAPSESSPPFLLQIPLKGVSDDDFDEDESLTQSLSASMVLGLKRGASQNVRVHSVHAQDGGYAVVGRAAGADVLLPEQSVSKRHARLQVGQNGALRVMDLESQNGTFHQDRRLPVGVYVDVSPGETLRFARYAGLYLSPDNLRDLLDHLRRRSG